MLAATDSAASRATSVPAVEFDVQLTPSDLFRADRAIVLRKLKGFLILSAAFVLMRSLAGGGLVLLFFIAFLWFCLYWVHSAFAYLGAKSNLRSNRVLSSPIHYSLSPSGLRTSGPTFWNEQSWASVHDLVETRQALILRVSTAQKSVIPKRCLSAEASNALRDFVKRKESLAPQFARSERTAPTPLVTASFRMTAEDLYWGFMTMLLRKSFWYAAQLVFAFAFIFMINPQFLSPLAFVTVGAIFFLYLSIALYFSSAQAIKTNVNYQNELQYALNEKGLDCWGPTFTFHHDWEDYKSILETSRAFVLCLSTSQMAILPKRALTDGGKIETLRILLKMHYRGKLSLKS